MRKNTGGRSGHVSGDAPRDAAGDSSPRIAHLSTRKIDGHSLEVFDLVRALEASTFPPLGEATAAGEASIKRWSLNKHPCE
jgi:hypothetical protein